MIFVSFSSILFSLWPAKRFSGSPSSYSDKNTVQKLQKNCVEKEQNEVPVKRKLRHKRMNREGFRIARQGLKLYMDCITRWIFLKGFKIKSIFFSVLWWFSNFFEYLTLVILIVRFLLASIKLLNNFKNHRASEAAILTLKTPTVTRSLNIIFNQAAKNDKKQLRCAWT